MLLQDEAADRMPGPEERGVTPTGILFFEWVLLQVVPNHREREFMQRLRGRGWVKASQIPDAAITLKHLLEKRWVESRGLGSSASYRITEEGIAAKTALIPLKRP